MNSVRRLSICDIDEGFNYVSANTIDQEEDKRTLWDRYFPIRDTLNIDRLQYCISQYLEAEFDLETVGNRGLGRTTEAVPRFGGYYRKGLARLQQEAIEELYVVAREILLRGYLVHLLFIDQGEASRSLPSAEELYEQWIPRIYVTGFEEFPESLQKVFVAFAEDRIKRFLQIFDQNGVKRRPGLFKKDLTPPILLYYVIAGFGLRTVEVGR